MISLTDVLHNLVRRGLTLRIDQEGNLFIYAPPRQAPGADAAKPKEPAPSQGAKEPAPKGRPTQPAPAAAKAPAAARQADAAAAASRRKPPLPEAGMPAPRWAAGQHWRGITWHDVPGHDKFTKKMNFSLLRRGLLRGHRSCAPLEGEALRQELNDLSERNRHNSRLHRAEPPAQPPPQPPPPKPSRPAS